MFTAYLHMLWFIFAFNSLSEVFSWNYIIFGYHMLRWYTNFPLPHHLKLWKSRKMWKSAQSSVGWSFFKQKKKKIRNIISFWIPLGEFLYARCKRIVLNFQLEKKFPSFSPSEKIKIWTNKICIFNFFLLFVKKCYFDSKFNAEYTSQMSLELWTSLLYGPERLHLPHK